MKKPCYIRIKFDCCNFTDVELNIKVEVDDLKPEEQNMQTGMLATESVQCQEVQQPRASATLAASESVSCPQTEDLQILREEIFLSVVRDYLQTTPPQSSDEFKMFREFVREMRLTITGTDMFELLWKVVVNSNNNLLFDKTFMNYLNAIWTLVLL